MASHYHFSLDGNIHIIKIKNVNVFWMQTFVLCSIILSLFLWNNEMINRFDERVANESFNAETLQSQQKQTN